MFWPHAKANEMNNVAHRQQQQQKEQQQNNATTKWEKMKKRNGKRERDKHKYKQQAEE